MKGNTDTVFIDDLSLGDVETVASDDKESEADQWAQEALISADVWNQSSICSNPTPLRVDELAHELGIHPAIIAGRIRKELHDYRLLTHYVGNGEVRKHLEKVIV